MDFLKRLNPQQREAVCRLEGPLLILAGAGSGKTRVITHRIAYLIGRNSALSSKILAVTFTNKAADEMLQRVRLLLGGAGLAGSPWISTFHSFCVRLLRRDGLSLADLRPGFTRQFSIYDEDDQLAVIKAVFRSLGLDEKFMQYRAAQSRISFAKNHKQTPADFYKASTDPKTSRLAVVFEEYEARLRQANALDFDDLLLESVRLLQHDNSVRFEYNRRFEYLMIDEYQDTNRSQYELMRLLTQTQQNVCVVGDEDQSIYGWRGADIRNILDFERDYPNARTIRLEQNYRSTKHILEAASSVVAHNTERKGKWLWTDAAAGALIGLYEAAEAGQEALFIADTIQRISAEEPGERFAVLYRTNFQSRQIEEALRRYGLKYLVIGGFSFYRRAEIKDALAYLKLLISPNDTVSLLRIINTPARGIGRSTVQQLERYASQHKLSTWTSIGRMLEEKVFGARAEAALAAFHGVIEELRDAADGEPVQNVLQMILERSGYRRMLEGDDLPESESRRDNLNELLNAAAEAAERGEGIAEFLDHAALVAETDELNENAQISLLTLHNAKGLEFPTVFIAGLEEGLFPHSRSLASQSMMEEERRLCYVGMTRAQKRLFLTWSRERRRFGFGQPEPCTPSRFLAEVPPHLTENLVEGRSLRQVNLFVERRSARESARRNTYTGKTYNSVEHIQQFFAGRRESGTAKVVHEGHSELVPRQALQSGRKGRGPKGASLGSTVEHPRYGRGTVVRREGEGDDAKITVSFPGYGLKKLIAKYAGLKTDE
jgi:DNA helicase-2/ATP-dependent DNA helicase PcrA